MPIEQLRAWARQRPSADADGPGWLALVIGIVLAAQANTSRPLGIVIALLLALVLVIATRWRVGWLLIAALIVAGVAMRLDLYGVGRSDVLAVTRSAIDVVLNGGNPYGIGYPSSSPPGAPFPYGPLAIFWYLPFRNDPQALEFSVSLLILAVLALRGRPIGLAIYALAGPLLLLASDGSNDTSAGLLLLIALVALPRSPLAGGVLLAVAAAFKPYAVAWLPPLVAWAPLQGLLGFGAASLIAWLPVWLAWGIPSFLDSFGRAQAVHSQPYYSLGAWVQSVTRSAVSQEAFDRLRLLLGAVIAIVTWPFVRSGRGVIVAGLLIYLVTLYSGYWSTYAYLATIAPIVCWNLDDWVGLARGRVRWPGDPVAAWSAWADARWPILAPR
ncbi:MAG: hypothetical protein ACXVAE_06710 [Candidatus Limnocylindrales bacterium]